MNIAIIGYGSLIWDLDDLAPKVTGAWQRGRGPRMPVEFTRVSPKRQMGLALVIHPDVPEPSATSYLVSTRNDLQQAIGDLADRERAVVEHIGYATRAGDYFSRTPGMAEAIAGWLEETTLDAVVWTDLDGNFDAHTGETFSHTAGLAYLRSLTGNSLQEAWRYITYAPHETDTPFRRFLSTDSWWGSLTFPPADCKLEIV